MPHKFHLYLIYLFETCLQDVDLEVERAKRRRMKKQRQNKEGRRRQMRRKRIQGNNNLKIRKISKPTNEENEEPVEE